MLVHYSTPLPVSFLNTRIYIYIYIYSFVDIDIQQKVISGITGLCRRLLMPHKLFHVFGLQPFYFKTLNQFKKNSYFFYFLIFFYIGELGL